MNTPIELLKERLSEIRAMEIQCKMNDNTEDLSTLVLHRMLYLDAIKAISKAKAPAKSYKEHEHLVGLSPDADAPPVLKYKDIQIIKKPKKVESQKKKIERIIKKRLERKSEPIKLKNGKEIKRLSMNDYRLM